MVKGLQQTSKMQLDTDRDIHTDQSQLRETILPIMLLLCLEFSQSYRQTDQVATRIYFVRQWMYHIYRTWISTAFWKQEVWHDIVLFKYDSSSCIQYVAHYQKGKANSVSEISDMLFQFL